MEITIVFAIVFICSMVNLYSERKKEKEKRLECEEDETLNQSDASEHDDAEMPDTMGLMFNSLCELGCQPTKFSPSALRVQYQGENFHIEIGGMYARVWDPMWAGVKADDPSLPKIREAVNDANFNFGPTVVLSAPDDEGVIGFHSRRDIMLHPACPDNTFYVKAVLDSFFDAKENFRNSFQQITARQMEAQKSRRPVGFATSDACKPE